MSDEIYLYPTLRPLVMLVIRQYPDGQLIQSLEAQLALVLEERDRILNILEAV